MDTKGHLLIFGFGFTGERLGKRLLEIGWKIKGTVRTTEKKVQLEKLYPDNASIVVVNEETKQEEYKAIFEDITHVLISTPVNPVSGRDPILEKMEDIIRTTAAAGNVLWAGYLSTTGVYGDTKGKPVDETSECNPVTKRGVGRLRAETEWLKSGLPMHIFRLPGIYGPGRGSMARLRKGTQRRIAKENQFFSRIHVDDIVGAVMNSIDNPNPGRVYNVSDDYPCANVEVVDYCCKLMKIEPPPLQQFEDIKESISPMARSFYEQSRKVVNTRLKDELKYALLYPTYKEGLKAQLEEETKNEENMSTDKSEPDLPAKEAAKSSAFSCSIN